MGTVITRNLRAGASVWRALLVAGLVGLVAACSGSDPEPDPGPATGSVEGRVVSAEDGTPVAGATVTVVGNTQAATTDADGRYTLREVIAAARVLLRIEAAGRAPALRVVGVAADARTADAAPLLAEDLRQSFDPAAAATVTDPSTGARLTAPANAWRRSRDGAAPTGALVARLTSVDPARDPERMPGDYTAVEGGQVQRLESFGALQVDVRDAAGDVFNLAPGTTAQLRIPASGRGSLPATVGLYSMDEVSGRWLPEGSATLAGSGGQRWYEATVSHLSWWNADQPLETVFVDVCVRDVQGNAAAGRRVRSEGLDYNGRELVASDAGGRARVAVKRGGVARITVEPFGTPATGAPVPLRVGPALADLAVEACLQERTAGERVPVIVAEPDDVTVLAGNTARFAVMVDGSEPLRIQWQRNAVDLPGASGPVLVFTALRSDDGARYRAVVTNAQGTASSREARLSVFELPPQLPVIELEPADASVQAGAVAVFAVSARGSAPLGYQWRRDGQPLAGETGSELRVAAALADDGARFSVVVSNSAGSASSRDALLSVAPAGDGLPIITSAPTSVTVAEGETASFSVVASGDGPLAYQWRRNGVAIAGATDTRYGLVATLADHLARFSVVVTNARGSRESAPATLSVTGVPASGTLAVSGAAAAGTDGRFTPSVGQSTVTTIGPTCLPAARDCTSFFFLTALERAPGAPQGLYEQLGLAIASVVPVPGAAPGTQAFSVVATFTYVKSTGSAVVAGAFELQCKEGETPCGSPGASGVTVDPAARTIRFDNVTLRDPENAATTTLDGVLSY